MFIIEDDNTDMIANKKVQVQKKFNSNNQNEHKAKMINLASVCYAIGGACVIFIALLCVFDVISIVEEIKSGQYLTLIFWGVAVILFSYGYYGLEKDKQIN